MTDVYYRGITLDEIYSSPERYAWNCLLIYRQFTREELLHFKQFLDIPRLVSHQLSATLDFLRSHFAQEIDDCLEIDWVDVIKYTLNRG
jgi:hypothetical protein